MYTSARLSKHHHTGLSLSSCQIRFLFESGAAAAAAAAAEAAGDSRLETERYQRDTTRARDLRDTLLSLKHDTEGMSTLSIVVITID